MTYASAARAFIIAAHTYTPNGGCRCGILPLDATREDHAAHVADMVAERVLLDLVSPATIAARLEVSRAAVSNWAARESAGFPPPLDVPGIPGPVYSWDAVREWHNVRQSIAADARAMRVAALRAKIDALTEELERIEE